VKDGMKAIIETLALAALTGGQTPSAPILGYWKNPSGSAIIGIAPCGEVLCGKVAWASQQGQREASKSTSHVVGTTVLTGLRRSGDRWTGTLFIPDDNIHVAARLQPIGNRELKLTGCALAGLFCRTQVWTRTDEPLRSPD
jgi:uncharacterized protein (DUF2147 family)